MAKARFTEEQIADFLQQSKSGVPDKVLCETYGFSISTLRRWRELHAARVRSELKKLESTAAIVYPGFLIVAVLLSVAFSKMVGALILPLLLLYCIYYIRRFRDISARHINEENTVIARMGRGANNAFYLFCWVVIILVIFTIGYGIVRLG